MSLPNVKISFANGAIGAVGAMDDGVCGLIAHGVAVSTTFVLGTPYLLTSLASLESLGVTESATGANALVYKTVKEFYSEAPKGSKLWIMAVASSVSLSDMVDKDKAHAPALLSAASGEIRCLMVKAVPGTNDTIASTVLSAAQKLQALAVEWTDNHYAPFFGLLEGLKYNGTASSLTNLSTCSYNRVGIVLGDTVANSTGAAVGLVGGRIAAVPVQRCIARVKDGAIAADAMYLGGETADVHDTAVVHDAGYICPRTFVGKAGYFWADDLLATAASDDYRTIANRRVADKAFRIAYKTMAEEVGNEYPVTDEGMMLPAACKALENMLESAIVNGMTSEGNLGANPNDDNDLGVDCVVDPSQNIVSTSTINIALRVKPYGYGKYINVGIGFLVNN